MPARFLTAKMVQGLSASPAGQVEYFDTKVPGLALRVTRQGVKSWTLVYRHEGRVRRWTIGRYPALSLADAREKAADARRDITHGADPAGEKQLRRQVPTIAEIAAQFLTLHAKVQKLTWREDKRVLRADVFPFWGHRPASSIGRQDVFLLLDRIVARGAPIQANRTLSVVRKMFNWAVVRELVEHSPCLMVKAPSRERTRDRVLTAPEIVQVWQACERTRTYRLLRGRCLRCFSPPFCPGSVLMDTDDRGSNHGVFVVSICGKRFEHLAPYTGFRPAALAAVHSVPSPAACRKITPGHTGAVPGEHRLDKQPGFSVAVTPTVSARPGSKCCIFSHGSSRHP